MLCHCGAPLPTHLTAAISPTLPLHQHPSLLLPRPTPGWRENPAWIAPPQHSAPHTQVPSSPTRTHCRRAPSARSPTQLGSCRGLKAPSVPHTHPPRSPRPGSLLSGSDFRESRRARFSAGAWTTGQGLGWEAKKEEAFLSSGTLFSGAEGLALPQDGLYYLYCHVGYRGRAPPPAVEPPDRSVTLLSRLYRAGGAYGSGTPELLLEGAETVTPVSDPARRHDYGPLWYTSVGFGGLVQLRRGERVYVNISHPDMVDYRRGKTFFGAVMVG